MRAGQPLAASKHLLIGVSIMCSRSRLLCLGGEAMGGEGRGEEGGVDYISSNRRAPGDDSLSGG